VPSPDGAFCRSDCLGVSGVLPPLLGRC